MRSKTLNEGEGRRRRKHKQLLVDLMEKRGYWKLKAETLYGTLNRTCFWKRL